MQCILLYNSPFCFVVQIRFQTKNYSAESIEAMKELDDVLVQLAVSLCVYERERVSVCFIPSLLIQSSVPVDLMPGLHDPTNHQLPQQPLHRCMFPQAGQLQSLRGVTNPYAATVNGIS